jgi:ParB family chromosome partitioning protein
MRSIPAQSPGVPRGELLARLLTTEGEGGDESEAPGAEPVQVFSPVWICRDPEAAGLVQRWSYLTRARKTDDPDPEATAEAAREERRIVIANNKAWTSAEVVRRDWLRQFLTRKTPPTGAEALICEAVVSGQFTLTKAMDAAHPMLRELLGLDIASVYGGGRQSCERLAAQQASPKAATMSTIAAVVAAWEAGTGKHTWRNPNAWDARVLGALTAWGYQPSEVESLLLATDPTDDGPPTEAPADEPTNEPTDGQTVAV